MENAGTNFNTHNLSDDFVNDMFHRYVERHISVDAQEKTPVCPFKTCGECNTAYSDSCYTCEFAKEAYMESVSIRSELSPEEKSLLDKEIAKILYKKRCERKGAKVFCISCGAGNRSPLRKWRNVYICSDCWKIKERIGEEQFLKALKGISE